LVAPGKEILMSTARSRTKKTGTKPRARKRKQSEIKIPDCCPYRSTSGYAKAFSLLWRASQSTKNGISRRDLIRQYATATGKPEKLAAYDVQVVLSPTNEGGGHASSKKYAYWVEKTAGFCRLHMAED